MRDIIPLDARASPPLCVWMVVNNGYRADGGLFNWEHRKSALQLVILARRRVEELDPHPNCDRDD